MTGYTIAAIGAGRDHTLALTADGHVIGWGGDGSGRIAAPSIEYCSTAKAPARPVEVKLGQPLAAIAAGFGVSLGITGMQEVVVWGANAAGIAGRRNAIALAEPQPVAGVVDARAIAADEFLFGAIDREGALVTWGLNLEGALGRVTPAINAAPGIVAIDEPLADLAIGKGYMLALTRDGGACA